MDAFKLILRLDRYANLELERSYWLSGDNADEGPSYCLECAKKELAKGLGEYISGGEYAQECDTYEQCYMCAKMLDYHLTDHGAEREYDWLKYKRFKRLGRDNAYMVARILDSDHHNKKYMRLAERAAKGIKR